METKTQKENPACPECNNHADSGNWELIKKVEATESLWLCKNCGEEVKDSEFIPYEEEA